MRTIITLAPEVPLTRTVFTETFLDAFQRERLLPEQIEVQLCEQHWRDCAGFGQIDPTEVKSAEEKKQLCGVKVVRSRLAVSRMIVIGEEGP